MTKDNITKYTEFFGEENGDCASHLNKFRKYIFCWLTMTSGPCLHGTARPQVEDGGTASNMDSSIKYIE